MFGLARNPELISSPLIGLSVELISHSGMGRREPNAPERQSLPHFIQKKE
jgi:hypothetical protein